MATSTIFGISMKTSVQWHIGVDKNQTLVPEIFFQKIYFFLKKTFNSNEISKSYTLWHLFGCFEYGKHTKFYVSCMLFPIA
jgi:hypothetical protein